MIVYPMILSAAAFLATLAYASYLDLKDRRVPFGTWFPMLALGIPSTLYMLFETTGNLSLILGYLSLISAFFYANHLDSCEGEKKVNFLFTAAVIILPAVSWLALAPLSFSIVPWFAMFTGVILYVTWVAHTGAQKSARKKKRMAQVTTADAISRWYFVLILIIFAVVATMMLYNRVWGSPALVVLLTAIFAGLFYVFGRAQLFGGADAWALIFIAFCVPVFPFTPLLGEPPLGFFAFSVLVNALLLNLAAPIGIFVINLMKSNRAPLPYMFFGFPVRGEEIRKSWGFVMEDLEEKNGIVTRKFIGIGDSIQRMYTGSGRIYTKDLREHPEQYERELETYRKAGTVWISYAVPFIVPIAAGFISAVIFGDFLFAIMKSVTGA